MTNAIGERLRLLREERGLSQSEFAAHMNVNRMTINNYENGKRNPDIGFAANAARFFDVTLEYLTGKSEFRNREDMLGAVEKANRFLRIIEETPQTEGQQLLVALCELLELAGGTDSSTPILVSLNSAVMEFTRILESYSEAEENIVRNVAELRWQKIQPALIQWTCLEKTKVLNENVFDAANGISDSLRLCAKMLSQKLLKTLETEAEKESVE